MAASVWLMGYPPSRKVDETSLILKRFYEIERTAMRTLAGYLAAVSDWELKLTLPRHFWQDSLRADALRGRVLELRYPRRDVDQGFDESLGACLDLLIRCRGDAELLEGVYFAVKRQLLTAYEWYLEQSDPLDDGPTYEFMRHFAGALRDQLHEIRQVYVQLPEYTGNISEWQNTLAKHFELLLRQRNMLPPLGREPDAPLPDLPSRAEYVPPLVPVRDPKFLPARFHLHPQEPQTFIERQVRLAINHMNEIWAAEIPGLLMWRWNDMPWEFYLDYARWAYDESRHARMGMQRLEAWGFKVGFDIPVCADHYTAVSGQGEIHVLALLHAFELLAPPIKQAMKQEFETAGDTASSQDFDYDWADESIHLQYGHKWLFHRLGGDLDVLEDMKASAMQRWRDCYKQWQREWDYEPFQSRIAAKIRELEAASHG